MRRFIRFLIILIVLVAILAGAATGFVIYTTRRMLPQYSGILALPGLQREVTIYRDARGVAHIYATTDDDLFFAQGVVHAQERWWQMEFQRHVGLGRIGELTGKNEDVLRLDTFIRTAGWNRAAQADLGVLSLESKRVLEAYSKGVNAYIAGKSGADLAVEYSLLGITGVNIPLEQWQPLHSLAWAKVLAWNLTGNMDDELTLATLLKKLGPKARGRIETEFIPAFPLDRHPTILYPEDLPAQAAVLPPPQAESAQTLDMETVQTELVGGLSLRDMRRALPVSASNSWVVNGTWTASGKPLLANDPHLGIQMPSLFYQVGLHCAPVSAECPYNVTGFGLPGTPGVLIGFNERIAWGLTTPYTDTQDLYAIQLDPNDDTKYVVDGQTLDMEVVTEEIRFGDGEPPVKLRVRVTRFGPIITDSPTHAERSDRPLALRWAGADEPYDLPGALMGINRAKNWDEFRTALQGWTIPSQNFVYADVDGNIGYQLPGRVPVRAPGHNGLTPADGATTRFDWRGYIPFDSLPRIYNPARGYIVTANQRIAPPDYNTRLESALSAQFGSEATYLIDFGADYGFRARRATDLLTQETKHTVESFRVRQVDNYNGFAVAILPLVLKLDLGDSAPRAVLDWLGGWDYVSLAESGPAALFEMFWARLVHNLFADEMGETPSGGSLFMGATLRLFEQPDSAWWDDLSTTGAKETRDDIVKRSMKEAYDDLVKRLGSDYQKWTWGALHTATFVNNPLGLSGIGLIEGFVNAGPMPAHGSITTLNRAAWDASEPFGVTSITALRIVVDLANLNNSVGIHTTGQSGHPASVYYRDMIETWRTGGHEPLPLDRSAVEKGSGFTLTLQPK